MRAKNVTFMMKILPLFGLINAGALAHKPEQASSQITSLRRLVSAFCYQCGSYFSLLLEGKVCSSSTGWTICIGVYCANSEKITLS